MKNKIIFILIFISIFLIIIIFINKIKTFNFSNNQLAQIVNIEAKLIKEWQQSFGLKNNLKYGTSNYEVQLLQKLLSQDKKIYPENKITGFYGDLTLKAVLNFQKEYNLPQTGEVDELTRNKINEIFLKFMCPEPKKEYPDFFLRKITKNNPLPLDYTPPDLVMAPKEIKTIGIICLRKIIISDLTQMFEDAKKENIYFAISSGFRNADIQKFLYEFWLQFQGPSALNEIAMPRFSEHQLGTAIDLTDNSINYEPVSQNFENSNGYKWLKNNAYKYGFILSFPKNKEKITGYTYEPWHYRYVGKEIAKIIYEKNITFAEYSENFNR
jgi:D-alanyl-D-alanine carboxypeptidase